MLKLRHCQPEFISVDRADRADAVSVDTNCYYRAVKFKTGAAVGNAFDIIVASVATAALSWILRSHSRRAL